MYFKLYYDQGSKIINAGVFDNVFNMSLCPKLLINFILCFILHVQCRSEYSVATAVSARSNTYSEASVAFSTKSETPGGSKSNVEDDFVCKNIIIFQVILLFIIFFYLT